jgi:hypothetical protein
VGTGNRRTIVLTAAMLIGTSCSSPAERGVAQQPTEEAIALFDYDSSLPLDLQTHGIESLDGLTVHDISFSSPKGAECRATSSFPTERVPLPAC